MRIDQLLRSSPMDVWLLKEYGKFRKAMAKDENSLYKAVAEQLYPCQNYYDKVRAKCLAYFTDDQCEAGDKDYEKLNELEKLSIISSAFERNILLFRKCHVTPLTIGNFGGTRNPVVLRLTEDGFYEALLDLAHMETGAFCQSIVYEMLYESVFGFNHDEVLETVDNVRKKRYNTVQPGLQYQANTSSSSSSDERHSPTTTSSPVKENWDMVEINYPPFPFRVAKSLDPDFYRNAQYDIWLDQKKEALQQIKPGDKVTVKIDADMDTVYRGHVQDVSPDNGPVCVFVEELGQKINVSHEALARIPVPSSKTPLKKYRKPLTRHARDSWSDDKVGSSPDSGCCTAPPGMNLMGRQRTNTMSSISPPGPTAHMSYGGSPPLRYTQTPPHPSWLGGYLPQGPPQPPPQQPMPMQQSQMLYGPPIQQHTQYIPGPPPPMPSPAGMQPPQPQYTQQPCSYYGEPYQPDPMYGMPAPGGQIPPGGLVVVTDPLQCGPPPMSLQSPYNTPPILGPIPQCLPSSSLTLTIPFLDTIHTNAVNYQSSASSDIHGRDLPHSDVNTLRFFYNLGCQSYQSALYGQGPTSYNCGPVVAPPPSPSSPSMMQRMCGSNATQRVS